MTDRRYLQLDVFAPRPGAGNPLGVVVDAGGLDDAAMQALAAWLKLSETVFFLPPTALDADYRIRIFTPQKELPFAGHPSVGAAWAACELGLAQPRDGRLVQQCAAGLLPVTVRHADGLRIASVRSPLARRRDVAAPALPGSLALAAAPAQPATLWNNGPDWWLLEVVDEVALRTLQVDQAALATLPHTGDLAAFALCDGDDYRMAVRAFVAEAGVTEDPVTGSANALIAASLHAQGRLQGGTGYLASQGREIGHDGIVAVQLDTTGEVWIGGHVQPVIDGRLSW